MDEKLSSFKSLEDVVIKATSNMEIDGKTFKEGEIIAFFDKIQISNFNEVKSYISANGGYGNPGLVFWETTKQINFQFSQGVFNNTQFSLLNNAKVIKNEDEEPLLITKIEELESNDNAEVEVSFSPVDQVFVYNKATGEVLHPIRVIDKVIRVPNPYQDVVVTYRYNYLGGGSVAKIGQRAISGFLELEGKTRVKDDTSGLITTGIIKIPKLKLMSGLSIRLGEQANPVVGNFAAVGLPVESRNNSYVAEIYFLNHDIDSDM